MKMREECRDGNQGGEGERRRDLGTTQLKPRGQEK